MHIFGNNLSNRVVCGLYTPKPQQCFCSTAITIGNPLPTNSNRELNLNHWVPFIATGTNFITNLKWNQQIDCHIFIVEKKKLHTLHLPQTKIVVFPFQRSLNPSSHFFQYFFFCFSIWENDMIKMNISSIHFMRIYQKHFFMKIYCIMRRKKESLWSFYNILTNGKSFFSMLSEKNTHAKICTERCENNNNNRIYTLCVCV